MGTGASVVGTAPWRSRARGLDVLLSRAWP